MVQFSISVYIRFTILYAYMCQFEARSSMQSHAKSEHSFGRQFAYHPYNAYIMGIQGKT